MRVCLRRGEWTVKDPVTVVEVWLDGSYVFGLWTLLALRYLELDFLAFAEFAVAACCDCGVVDEDVGARAFLLDESVSLVGVEPLDSTRGHTQPSSVS